jgi:nucleotide-binding universal stress UspA family protein
MQRFKNILINLSLREEEVSVLEWSGAVATMGESDRITVLHTWDTVDIPAELKDRYPWLLEPGQEESLKRMTLLVEEHLKAPPITQIERLIKQGSALGEVLTIAETGEVDLVVCGRSETDLRLSERLARKAPCSVLSVPPSAPSKFHRVLVPIDFSSFSKQALEIAMAFAYAAGADLTLMHAFTVPRGEAKAITTRPEIVTEFAEIHDARLKRLVASLDTRGVKISTQVVESSSTPAAVSRVVEAGGHDLVVIGCRGRHAIYATLLGSTAEAILHGCPVPVVAVKSKTAGRDILAALRNN